MTPEIQAGTSSPELVSEIRIPVGATAAADSRWHFSTCFLFRFAFCYFVLYTFPFPLGQLPYTDWPASKYESMWKVVVPWVGRHILHLHQDITVFTNGSGDTTFDWVLMLCYLTLAATATLVWTALDRKRNHHRYLFNWMRLYIRFVLAAAMISYGAYKVIPAQFPQPSMSRLVENYGDSSPMGLLWTFMGASPAYQRFAGVMELLSGILLVIPGLTVLGALFSFAVLTNIFLLNMCYDTPVKLYSFHLLLMSVFLLAPDMKGLADFLVLRRKSKLREDAALFQRKRLCQAALAVQLLFGTYLVGTSLYQSNQQYTDFNQRPPHYGVWSVEEFSVDGQPRPALVNDATRWRRVFFEYENFWGLQFMDGPRRNFQLKLDEGKKTLTLAKHDDPKWNSVLTFEDTQPDQMTLTGQFDGHQVTAKLKRVDTGAYLLNSRGFHWINEYPFNR